MVESFLRDPDSVVAVIRLALPMKQWKEVRKAIENDKQQSGPWQLDRCISELIQKMEKHFYANVEE